MATIRKRALLATAVAALLVFAMSRPLQAAPAQSFCTGNATGPCPFGAAPVKWDVCYDDTNATNVPGPPSMPVGPVPISGVIPCGPNTSDSQIPVGTGVPIKEYEIVSVPFGSRTTAPVVYTPSVWGSASTTPGTVTGEVSTITDLLCDGSSDILSPTQEQSPFGDTTTWPGHGWGTGFNFIRQNLGSAAPLGGPPDVTTGSVNGYIDSIKPMPASFTDVSLDRSNLLQLWLAGTTPITLPPTGTAGGANDGTALQNLATVSPYVPGLEVSATLSLGIYDVRATNPPTQSFLCLDSPQSSVARHTTLVPPTVPGNYVRWAAMESAPDIIDGTVTRIVDTQCVNVGGAPGTCDLSDADGDLLPHDVEVAFGSDPNISDTDGDGASDYDEMFQYSDPRNPDTDGDGHLDKQEDLAGFNCAAVNGVCTVTNYGLSLAATDNCPVNANPAQDNTDSRPDFTNTPNTPNGAIYRGDATNPHQDHMGDACDSDMDNDGLNNVVEAGFQHPNLSPGSASGPAAGTLYCLPLTDTSTIGLGGSTVVSTDPLNSDTDSDGGLDGRECLFGSDPLSASANSCQPACSGTNRFPASVGDTDGDQISGTIVAGGNAAETFYRTQHINLPGGGVLNDLEQPGSYGSTIPDGKIGNADNDSDGDLLNDGVEVKWYGTSPANFDTDGDGCSDGREAADVNGDHKVNSADLLGVAQHSSTGDLAPGKVGVPLPLGSPAPAYWVAGVRRGELATYDLNKDGKIDATDLLTVAKLIGRCAAGVGAQTALPIVRSAG